MSHRRGTALLVALSLVGAVGLVGSAGASVAEKKKPLTKKAFIKEADKICLQGNTLVEEIFDEQPDLAPGEEPDAAFFEAFWEEAGPVLQQEVDSVDALNEPKADKKKIKKMLDALQDGIDEINDDPSLLFEQDSLDPFDKASQLAQDYGFKVCGADDAA